MTSTESLTCSISNTSFGKILVASGSTGICALYVSDQTDRLLSALSHDFPYADTLLTRLTELPCPEDEWHQSALDIAIGLAAVPPPLDIKGTDFQHAVWQQLQTYPSGTTTNYGALAASLGQPDLIQAVVDACEANKIAVLIPCHRVKDNRGELGSYRWGVALKRRLLEREAE